VNLPNRCPLRPDHAGVLEVVQQPPAYSNGSVLVDNLVQVGLLPLVKRSGARRRFNDDGLADVIKISGVAQVDVPIDLIGLQKMAVRGFPWFFILDLDSVNQKSFDDYGCTRKVGGSI